MFLILNSLSCASLIVVPSVDKGDKSTWRPGDHLRSAFSQGQFLLQTGPTALLIFLRVSSLCASCPSIPPHPHGAALWPWLCGDFMKAFLQLVEGGGHMGWSSEEIGVGFLFSLWLRHVGEQFCRILLINNFFTPTPVRLPSVTVGIEGKRYLILMFPSTHLPPTILGRLLSGKLRGQAMFLPWPRLTIFRHGLLESKQELWEEMAYQQSHCEG